MTLVARVPPTSTRSSELRLLRIGSATVYVSINTEVSSTGSEQLVLANTYDSHYDTTLIEKTFSFPPSVPQGMGLLKAAALNLAMTIMATRATITAISKEA
jgi:hypothetical protein